jgi:hypothetical protein
VAVNAHLGNIAFKLGRKLYWDADAEEFPGDEEANALLTVDRREPWSLPRF